MILGELLGPRFNIPIPSLSFYTTLFSLGLAA